MSFSGDEWESVGSRSVLRLWLTDEQPGLCAESRGPGSLSREEEAEEVEEETVGGFMGFFCGSTHWSLWLPSEERRSRGRRGGGGDGYSFVGLKKYGIRRRSCVTAALTAFVIADGVLVWLLFNLLSIFATSIFCLYVINLLLLYKSLFKICLFVGRDLYICVCVYCCMC